MGDHVKVFIRSVVLAIAFSASAAAVGAEVQGSAESTAGQRLRDAAIHFDNGNVTEAERLARSVVEAPTFHSLSAEMRTASLQLLASAVLDQAPGRCPEILQRSDQLREIQVTNSELQRNNATLAFWSGYLCEDEARADAALITMIRQYPDALHETPDEAILQTAHDVTDVAALSFLVNGGWRPQEGASDLSWLRLQLVRLHLRQRELDRAREVAQALTLNGTTDARSLIILLVEQEFDPITQADPQTYNLDSILDWQMSNLRGRADAAPDVLQLQIQLAGALLLRNRLQEALTTIDTAIAHAEASTPEAPAFSDQADQINWAHNERSSIVEAMGNPEDALAALLRGVEAGENGETNVSQLLNRAASLVQYDRAAEALASLNGFDVAGASPYGQMVALRVRTCAHAQLGDTARAREVLNEMRRRENDSLVQLRSAAICANDLDLAARAFIRSMNSSRDRASTIVALQHFVDDEVRTNHQRTVEARAEQMRARRDVSAVIDRVTRIQTFSIRAP